MTAIDLRDMVLDMCRERSQRTVADELGVSASYLNDYLHFRREPGPKILEALDMRAVTTYERMMK